MLSSVFGLLCLRSVPQSSHTYSVIAVVDNEIVWTVTYLLIIPKRKEKKETGLLSRELCLLLGKESCPGLDDIGRKVCHGIYRPVIDL